MTGLYILFKSSLFNCLFRSLTSTYYCPWSRNLFSKALTIKSLSIIESSNDLIYLLKFASFYFKVSCLNTSSVSFIVTYVLSDSTSFNKLAITSSDWLVSTGVSCCSVVLNLILSKSSYLVVRSNSISACSSLICACSSSHCFSYNTLSCCIVSLVIADLWSFYSYTKSMCS
jgi:hypothetical protein